MHKKRNSVPKDIAEEIIYRADFRCCLCDARGHHIHHIDADPANNDYDNLVFLCFIHHNEATSKPGLARALTPGLLKRFRDDLYGRVAQRRLPPVAMSPDVVSVPDSDSVFQSMLDAGIMIEASKMYRRLSEADWEESAGLVHQLLLYPLVPGTKASSAILSVLSPLAGKARHGMPESVASAIVRVTMELVPFNTYSTNKPTSQEMDLLHQAASIGFSMAYDAALYSHNLQVVDAGAEILWRLLAIARSVEDGNLENHLLSEFERAEDAAHRGKNPLALELLQFAREHAQPRSEMAPDYPLHIIEALCK